MLNVFERDNNEHIHLVNVSLNVNLSDDYKILKYQSLDQTTKNLIFIKIRMWKYNFMLLIADI